MTPTPASSPMGTAPVPPRALWPIATFGSMLILIAVLTVRLFTVAPASASPAPALDGIRVLDSTTFATAPRLGTAASPLPSANR
jgi:hypothetical protein